MDTNTEQVINQFGNKLDNYIQITASKLGVATDHFWPIFVRQQKIRRFLFLYKLWSFNVNFNSLL
jgi:hypothetical protein